MLSPRPLVSVLCLAALGCGTRAPPAVEPAPGWSEAGVASWYGEPFHGRRTASGEIYDMEEMTAAHPWLPFGTIVRVENRDNGRSSRLRINDRGPFARGRILDVSRAGARALGMLGPGTARVRLVVVGLPEEPACVELQVGAFEDASNARALAEKLEASGLTVREERAPNGLRRVVAGPFGSLESARAARDRFGGYLRGCAAADR